MILLKQSTAATVKLGPFLDDTDGKTAETGLTISQADIRVSKVGGAFAQTNNAAGATHDENGWYNVPLDTTDTATLGRLDVSVSESGALPCWRDFMVVPANVFDSLVAGSDVLQADLTQINGATAPVDNLAEDYNGTGYTKVNSIIGVATALGANAITAPVIATDAITAAKIAADAIGSSELATTAVNAIRDAILDDATRFSGADIATLIVRLTAARAGYLDKLNITGNVSSQAEVLAIQNNTRTTIAIPTVIERPDAGSTRVKVYLNNYDTAGNMEAPDSAPTVAVENESGTDRSGNLQHPTTHTPQTTMVLIEAGRYWIEYDLATADPIENLNLTFTIIEGGVTRKIDRQVMVVDMTAVDFTTADRAKLDALHDTRIPDVLSLANINAEVDSALDTSIPGSPTADSINERIKTIDNKLPAGAIADGGQQDGQDTQIQLILDSLGGWTTGGVNNVLGAFKALLNKLASLPSDIGGSGDPSTDSVEALREFLATDTIAELPQAQPPATPTIPQVLSLLNMWIRNANTSSASERTIKNDAGTVIAKATTSDAAGKFDQGKLNTGP